MLNVKYGRRHGGDKLFGQQMSGCHPNPNLTNPNTKHTEAQSSITRTSAHHKIHHM